MIRTAQGFSLVEIVVVVGIFSLLGTVSVAVYVQYKDQAAFNSSEAHVLELIYETRHNAREGKKNSDWSLYNENNQITLFSGHDYELRDPTNDIILDLGGEVMISGPSMLTFEQVSGYPDTPETYAIQTSTEETIISINAYGTVTTE